MKHTLKRMLSLLLAALMLLPLAACSNGENGADTQADGSAPAVESGSEAATDRFADVNFGDREYAVYTSIYDYGNGMGNSNFLIEGTDESAGNHVNAAVLERNQITEQLLGIKLSYTQADLSYDAVAADVRKLVSSGTHEYDLIVNDLFPLAILSLEGSFRNALDEEAVFDFEQPYWYRDFMTDTTLLGNYQYILAGDYTADVLRSVHCLLFNKTMYNEYFHTDPNEPYEWVKNYEWTYDRMTETVSGIYADKNNSGKRDDGDTYGFIGCTYWAECIAFVTSAAPGFVERDEDGEVYIVLGQNDRAEELSEKILALFWNDGASVNVTDYTMLPDAFVEGQCLFVGNQRLGSLENPLFRNRNIEVGILPYPMLRASDKKYTTAAHDTTEIAVIPSTEPDLGFASTVVEVLCRETALRVLPQYYKESLQIKYVDDSYAADMIDIIHDNISESFVLCYNNALGSLMMNSFSEAVQNKRTFSAVFASRSRSLDNQLKSKLKSFRKKVGA